VIDLCLPLLLIFGYSVGVITYDLRINLTSDRRGICDFALASSVSIVPLLAPPRDSGVLVQRRIAQRGGGQDNSFV
jgi:hypothetical protein